jgi:hypothetical protein
MLTTPTLKTELFCKGMGVSLSRSQVPLVELISYIANLPFEKFMTAWVLLKWVSSKNISFVSLRPILKLLEPEFLAVNFIYLLIATPYIMVRMSSVSSAPALISSTKN